MKRLNLGCGKKILSGYINTDVAKLKGVDVVHNMEKFPWPFKNNEFDEILTIHVLEHVSDLCKTMEEIYRISKNNALIKIRVPYFASPEHHNDPTHKRKFTYNTFDYFTAQHYDYYSDARFEIIKKNIFFFTGKEFMKSKWFSFPFDFLINISPTIYQRFFCYLFPASEIHFLLKVKK